MLDRFHVPPDDEVRVHEVALRKTVTEVFEAAGVPAEDAAQAADVLVYADLRGIETHGVSNMLRVYRKLYEEGKLNPRPTFRLIKESDAGASYDGEGGLGIIQVPRAMRVAIEKASRHGVGAVTVRNIGHTGAIGYYAMMAADEEMVGLSMTASGSQVLPTFAGEPRLGTNPIAFAAPTRDQPRLFFDAAMSAIASNKIRLADRVGSSLLPGWIASWNGTPIMEEAPPPKDDLRQLPLGSTRELGSHKGYGLALMVEVLATLLSGDVPRMLDQNTGSRHIVAAFDIRAFTDLEQYYDTIDRMLTTLLETPPMPGQEQVVYPGWPEEQELRERTEHGIPLHREVVEWFNRTTDELGLERLETLTPA